MKQVGMVKWFDEAKGYGFITPAGGGPDIFVHFSNIQLEGYKTLTKGQQVQFEAFVGPKGPSALQVEITKDVDDAQKTTKPVKDAKTTPAIITADEEKIEETETDEDSD